MKKTWFFMLLAAVIGVSVAWFINYQRFGHRVGRFGPFTLDGSVTPENVMGIVNAGATASAGSTDLVTRDPGTMPPDTTPLARAEVVGSSEYDFGMMPPNSEGTHTFIIKSVGESDLRLRLGATTCKCTLGELENDTLSPGEQTEVTLSWTVQPGESSFSQSAQLITNDPQQVAITLQIVGKIVSDADVFPAEWSFGEVATGEPFEVGGTIYSFMDETIEPTEVKFSNDELNEFSDIKVEPYTPGETDGPRSVAKQAFKITANFRPGMRQGAVSQNLVFAFKKLDADGQPIEDNGTSTYYINVPTKGSVVGPLSMIENSKLKGSAGGNYLYDLGRIGEDEPLKFKTFVVLKGSERNNVDLRVGEVLPDGVVQATLGEPKGRGSMVLYPLEIELIPGEKPIERLGKNRDDYGSVWIESDNPTVSKMRVALKFAIPGR